MAPAAILQFDDDSAPFSGERRPVAIFETRMNTTRSGLRDITIDIVFSETGLIKEVSIFAHDRTHDSSCRMALDDARIEVLNLMGDPGRPSYLGP